jgi:hypothetical protein
MQLAQHGFPKLCLSFGLSVKPSYLMKTHSPFFAVQNEESLWDATEVYPHKVNITLEHVFSGSADRRERRVDPGGRKKTIHNETYFLNVTKFLCRTQSLYQKLWSS